MQPNKFIFNNKNILPRYKMSLKTNMALLKKTIYFPENVFYCKSPQNNNFSFL